MAEVLYILQASSDAGRIVACVPPIVTFSLSSAAEVLQLALELERFVAFLRESVDEEAHVRCWADTEPAPAEPS